MSSSVQSSSQLPELILVELKSGELSARGPVMKREARLLLRKAFDSLVLSIELFNRPHDCGRVSGSLIFLDHAFEMLLKASILHRGGSIRLDFDSAESGILAAQGIRGSEG